LTKIVCSDSTYLVPIGDYPSVEINQTTKDEFKDQNEKEHYITYKVLDDVSALEPQKKQHNIVIEIFALYMLICVYALSSVQHFKLKEIIKPEYYFGCSLREKLRSSKLKTCKKTKLDETENN
jgi:uncharacterized ion transporter superfamily protein YfcC